MNLEIMNNLQRKIMITTQISAAVLVFVFGCVKLSEGNTAAQCAQFGINDKHNWIYGNDGADTKTGYYTIAGVEFDAKYISSIGSRYSINVPIEMSLTASKPDGSCPWDFIATPAHLIEPCVNNSYVRMNMYLVKQQGRVLHGWLHVEIELLDQSDQIEIIYIQMRDEAFNAIGEFVTADNYPGATCKPSKSNLATPTYYEFFPCSATGLREAKTSAAVMMAKKEYYWNQKVVENRWVHEESMERGVHFLWKFEEYWCSRHEKIQPYAYILTSKNRELFERGASSSGPPYPRMLRKVPNYWLHQNWFGPADIIFAHGALDCSELAIDDNSGQVTSVAVNSWFLNNSTIVTLEGDNWHPKNRYALRNEAGYQIGNYGSNLCQADPLAPYQTRTTVPVFSGRCASHFAKDVGTDFFQGCNLDVDSPEFAAIKPILDQFKPYKTYNDQKIKDRLALCNPNNTCTSPNSTSHLQEMKANSPGDIILSNTTVSNVAGKTDVRTKAKLQKFWHGRKYHGILCSVVAFFITPVYIFIARYYKETFLRSRCYGVPIWYWIHVSGIIVAAMLFASGHAAISPNFPVWGRSLHPASVQHRIVGYFSVVIFGLLVVFGGFRCGPQAQGGGKLCRIFSITAHSLLGFFHYFLNFIAVILSSWIPQSPTLKECDKTSGLPVGIGAVALVAIAFTLIDLILHILLTVAQCFVDRKFGVSKRGWWCPILPLLPVSSLTDYAGGLMRKMIFLVYLLLSLILTFTVIYLIGGKELSYDCRTGPMSCKHAFGCTKLAIKYEEWFKNRGGDLENFM